MRRIKHQQEACCHKKPPHFLAHFPRISRAFSRAFSIAFSIAFLAHFPAHFLPLYSRISRAFLAHFPPHFSRFLKTVLVCVGFELWIVVFSSSRGGGFKMKFLTLWSFWGILSRYENASKLWGSDDNFTKIMAFKCFRIGQRRRRKFLI